VVSGKGSLADLSDDEAALDRFPIVRRRGNRTGDFVCFHVPT
jgi:hypothetical protein